MEEDEFFSRLRAGIDLMAQGRYQEASHSIVMLIIIRP
jgi:hypothetical protein